ncbi:MAG: hypothetical protein PHR07_04505 [Acidaminococcaceae bacterium]|nr:hypothetical protein [Acidaminococcaceae bacterium]
MASTKQNFELWQGEVKTITVTVLKQDGTAKDLTAASAIVWEMSTSVAALAPSITKSVGSGITVSTPATSGVFVIVLAHTDTHTMDPGVYHHEARVTDSAGVEEVVTIGEVTIHQSTTL